MYFEHKFFNWANLQGRITFATSADYDNCVGNVRVQDFNSVTKSVECLFDVNFTSPAERRKAIAKASRICSFQMSLPEEV